MNDFEKFSEYWEQAINGLIYRVNAVQHPILTKKQLQQIWVDELLHKRFFSKGVRHGARVFLDELLEHQPETGEKVTKLLQESVMPLGTDSVALVGNGCVALLGLSLGCAGNALKKHGMFKLGSLAVGGAFAAKTAQEALRGTKNTLIEAIEAESSRQLNGYREILTPHGE